jgi:hypothetical protein
MGRARYLLPENYTDHTPSIETRVKQALPFKYISGFLLTVFLH